MSTFQRIRIFIFGLAQIAVAVIMGYYSDKAFPYVVTILAFALFVWGIKHLHYYFTMARFMVDGRIILVLGVILLDLGIVSASLIDVPKIYIIIYLASIHAFSALVEVLRALESRRLGAKSWRLKLVQGIVELLMVVSCFVFIKNIAIVAIIYGLGLAYSGVMNAISAFRKNTLVFIQ